MAVSLHKPSLSRPQNKDFKLFRFYSKIRQDIQIFYYYAVSQYTPSHYAHAQCAHIITTL
jgi:hypothetical protein